jgi:putrescine aminotransferase
MKSEFQQKNTAHHFQPFSDNKELAEKGIKLISKAEGVYIYENNSDSYLHQAH